MNPKILIVDDDRNLLSACERILRCKFNLETAAGGPAALAKIQSSGPYAVVMADRQMPEMDGVQFLNKVREISPDTVRLMLTGNADMEAVIRLVNESNIFRFLTKPCPTNLLIQALEDAQRLYQLTVAEKELLNKTLNGSIKVLTDILAMTESPSFGPPQALREAIADAAARLGLENAWQIHLAVMLAPIGNVTVPPETLVRARSRQALSPAEEQMLNQRPETAARLLINIPRLEGVAQIVRYQNKCFDGSGLPIDEVAGDAIPVGARLLKIVHDYMDLHRGGTSIAEAFEAMRDRAGAYDPTLLDALQQSLEGKAHGQIKAAKVSAKVAAKDLVEGMLLRSNVETKDGVLILRAGHQITGMTLEKIQNFASVFGIKEPIMVESVETPA
jgi:response regulator RpfG family c-di-GMP phosphodiesterase